jgi:hypothetical protein
MIGKSTRRISVANGLTLLLLFAAACLFPLGSQAASCESLEPIS